MYNKHTAVETRAAYRGGHEDMTKKKHADGGIQKKRSGRAGANVAPPSRPTNIRLDEDLWLWVRMYAMKRRISARVVVTQAISEFMARTEKEG